MLLGIVTWVVDASLDDIVQGESARCLLFPQIGVHFRCEHLGHVVVVLAEVGVLLFRRVVHLQLVVGVSKRHDDVRAADLGAVGDKTVTLFNLIHITDSSCSQINKWFHSAHLNTVCQQQIQMSVFERVSSP